MPFVKGQECPNARDLIGFRSYKLLVVERLNSHKGRRLWKCVCDCGKHVIINTGDITRGVQKSCGCHKSKLTAQRNRDNAKHNMTGSRTYTTWFNMKQRCNYKKDPGFHNYGGRGITICKRWSEFLNFLADMGERPPGKTIDRINPNGNYTPKNCRWATPLEQSQNRRKKNDNHAA